MRLECGSESFDWVDNWTMIPDTESGRTNGRTHAIAVTDAGQIVVFHQANPAVLLFNADGSLETAWGDRFAGAHGMTLVREGNTEYLWLTDTISREVVKTTLDGQTVLQLQQPDIAAYETGKYAPTWVAVAEERYNGNGDIWVADGYGKNLIHRYDSSGRYLASLSGEEGSGGAFSCPHSVFLDTRRNEPEFYVADRSNSQIQVYSLDGTFKRVCGRGSVNRPCAFATYKNFLIIPEFRDHPRVTLLDGDDRLVGYLGQHPGVSDQPGWPNNRALVHAGLFNSPHDVAVDHEGNLFVVEWITGGRITKLARS